MRSRTWHLHSGCFYAWSPRFGRDGGGEKERKRETSFLDRPRYVDRETREGSEDVESGIYPHSDGQRADLHQCMHGSQVFHRVVQAGLPKGIENSGVVASSARWRPLALFLHLPLNCCTTTLRTPWSPQNIVSIRPRRSECTVQPAFPLFELLCLSALALTWALSAWALPGLSLSQPGKACFSLNTHPMVRYTKEVLPKPVQPVQPLDQSGWWRVVVTRKCGLCS